jgi:hypothetical protein
MEIIWGQQIMDIFSYLKTDEESVEKIKKARAKINKIIFLLFIEFFVVAVFTIYFILTGDTTKFALLILLGFSYCILNFVLLIGLVIKRELYSVMIFMKGENQ